MSSCSLVCDWRNLNSSSWEQNFLLTLDNAQNSSCNGGKQVQSCNERHLPLSLIYPIWNVSPSPRAYTSYSSSNTYASHTLLDTFCLLPILLFICLSIPLQFNHYLHVTLPFTLCLQYIRPMSILYLAQWIPELFYSAFREVWDCVNFFWQEWCTSFLFGNWCGIVLNHYLQPPPSLPLSSCLVIIHLCTSVCTNRTSMMALLKLFTVILCDQPPVLRIISRTKSLASRIYSRASGAMCRLVCLYLSSRFNSVISSRHWICKYGCSCNRRTWMHEKGRGQPKTMWIWQKKMRRRESQEARRTNQLEVTAEVKIKIKACPRWRQWQHQRLGQWKGGEKAKARTRGSKSHGLYSHSIIDPTTHIQLEVQGERFHTPGFYQRTLFFSNKSNLWQIQGHSNLCIMSKTNAAARAICEVMSLLQPYPQEPTHSQEHYKL